MEILKKLPTNFSVKSFCKPASELFIIVILLLLWLHSDSEFLRLGKYSGLNEKTFVSIIIYFRRFWKIYLFLGIWSNPFFKYFEYASGALLDSPNINDNNWLLHFYLNVQFPQHSLVLKFENSIIALYFHSTRSIYHLRFALVTQHQ